MTNKPHGLINFILSSLLYIYNSKQPSSFACQSKLLLQFSLFFPFLHSFDAKKRRKLIRGHGGIGVMAYPYRAKILTSKPLVA